MRATEFLAESLSRVAFHYTSLHNALKILTSGEFQLSSTLGSVEEQYAPKGHPYFLSTTRSSRGGYHNDRGGSGATLFVLDGNWFNQHYKAGPVDYWQNRNPQSNYHNAHEAEDRVFSRSPSIPIGGVKAIHVYIKPMDGSERQNWAPMAPAAARQILLSAKKQGIQAFLYEDVDAWLSLDTRKAVPITNRETLRGPDLRKERTSSKPRGYLMPWMELLQAKEVSQLSKVADRIRSSLQYTYDAQSAAEGLANNLSNARKPDSGGDRENAAKLIRFMQQNKLNTISELVKAIGNKWKAIAAKNPTTETQELDEFVMDNEKGAGAVPYNSNVDYFGLRVLMKPSTFLRLAEPLGKPHDPELEKYMAAGGAIGSPFLEIVIPEKWDDGDFNMPAQVKQHEGRNRATIIQKLEGDNPIEVHLIPLGGYRNRDLTPEFIKALSDSLFAQGTTRVVNGPLFTVSGVKEAAL